ncbi:hypothetical protein BDB00DRAFT_82279 [Zychaea mexicana]|uniref:uncharacterized protein n=1 Tax=Zychaea mexicana TaxID=64656 RepID=UPI0022FE9E33|nr:uncharacterized protein BDB00DRAFT_82279 [Zychaea mexicana]KAI9488011.1 hypothetical protein BDB00DRAFT_82279 [Zychaea mexicana]
MPSLVVLVDESDEQSWWLCRYWWQQISWAWFRIEDWQNPVFGLISLLAAHDHIHLMRNFFDGFFSDLTFLIITTTATTTTTTTTTTSNKCASKDKQHPMKRRIDILGKEQIYYLLVMLWRQVLSKRILVSALKILIKRRYIHSKLAWAN